MTEHKQEASPRVEAMEPSRRGCLLPRELPNKGNNNGNIELHKEGINNNGNIDFFPLYSKYTAAAGKMDFGIRRMKRLKYMTRIQISRLTKRISRFDGKTHFP